jgi:hypothetical protein
VKDLEINRAGSLLAKSILSEWDVNTSHGREQAGRSAWGFGRGNIGTENRKISMNWRWNGSSFPAKN